ncbi:MAG: hypothetical protein WC508_03100 [Patescibacteria group bacterium]
MKKPIFLVLICLFLLAAPFLVLAAEVQDQTVEIGADQIIEGNFIKAGNIIDIKGAVHGDVIVAGNSITISGPVAGDVIAAGSTIKITGAVLGSVRVIGNSVEVDSEVGHNVWAGGNNVVLGSNAKVAWDVFSAASSLEIKGPITGGLWAAANAISLSSEVGKDVNASLDKQGQLVLGSQAKIGGNLSYQAPNDQQLVLKDGAKVIGQTTRKTAVMPDRLDASKAFGTAFLFLKIISLFSLLIIGMVVVSLFSKVLLEVREEIVKKPWPSLVTGAVYSIAIPIVAILLMCTIIGIPLALIIIPFYIIVLYVSKVFVGFVIGLALLNSLSPEKKYKGSLMWPTVLGIIVFVFITSLPLLGWLIKLCLVWLAFGAFLATQKNIIRDYR